MEITQLWLNSWVLDHFYLTTLCVGLVTGFIINFTGIGGGILVVPLLTLLYRLDISVAVGTASIYVALVKSLASFENIRLKKINFRYSHYFLIGAIPGVLLASGGINYLLNQTLTLEENQALQSQIRAMVAVMIYFSTILILLKKQSIFKKLKTKLIGDKETSWLIFFGFLVGVILGLTGIGGVLMIPVLLLLSPITSKEAVIAANYIAFILSGIAAFIYGTGGQVDWELGFGLTVGSVVGIYFANFALKKISIKFLDYAIIILVVISATIMWIK